MNIYLAGTYGLGAKPWLGGILFSPDGSVGGASPQHKEGASIGAGVHSGNAQLQRQLRSTGWPRGGFDNLLASRVNLLESFYYLDQWQIDNLHHFKRFMLDSGGFTLAISKRGALGEKELNDYVSRYAEFVATNENARLWFEMDIDHVKGTDWVKRTTAWLERETGKIPIPVWHPCRGAKGFEEMCERYPYVAIGTTDIRKQLAKSVRWFTDTAHRYGSKIHGLGYTKLAGLERTGFDSVDSTAWLYGNRGGFVYEFTGASLAKHKAPPGKRLVARDAARHNFREWVRFSEYMETR